MRIFAILGLITLAVAALWHLTVAQQGATCEVCVSFQGRRACRAASAGTPDEATRSALATACALVTGGVTEDLACGRTPPETVVCE